MHVNSKLFTDTLRQLASDKGLALLESKDVEVELGGRCFISNLDEIPNKFKEHEISLKWAVKEGEAQRFVYLAASMHQLTETLNKLRIVEASKSSEIKVNPKMDDFDHGFWIDHKSCCKDHTEIFGISAFKVEMHRIYHLAMNASIQ